MTVGNLLERGGYAHDFHKKSVIFASRNSPELTSPACEVLGYFVPMNERDII